MGRSKHSGGEWEDTPFSANKAAAKLRRHNLRNEDALKDTTDAIRTIADKPAQASGSEASESKPKTNTYAPREGKKKKHYGKPFGDKIVE